MYVAINTKIIKFGVLENDQCTQFVSIVGQELHCINQFKRYGKRYRATISPPERYFAGVPIVAHFYLPTG